MPACSAAVSDPIAAVAGEDEREYLYIGSPDGMLFYYPAFGDGYDYDVSSGIADHDRTLGAYVDSSGVLWSNEGADIQGDIGNDLLAAQLVVFRSDEDGEIYHAILMGNTTGTHPDTVTGTVDKFVDHSGGTAPEWLEGRQPPVGNGDMSIGGIES